MHNEKVAYCKIIQSGDLSGGDQAVRRASELGGAECAASERRALETLRKLHEDAQRAMEANDYRRVVFCMDRCLDYSPSCTKLVTQIL